MTRLTNYIELLLSELSPISLVGSTQSYRWFEENATIKISLGRQKGHTTALVALANNYYNNLFGHAKQVERGAVLFIVPTDAHKRYIEKEYPLHVRINIYTYDDIENNKSNGANYNLVLIDCSGKPMPKKEIMAKIYNSCRVGTKIVIAQM